jgi:hypothetical protein
LAAGLGVLIGSGTLFPLAVSLLLFFQQTLLKLPLLKQPANKTTHT